MLRHILYRSLLTGLLILGFTLPSYAEQNGPPVSRGIVLTIMALDPKTHTATLRADDGGKEFQTSNSGFWKIGSKMLCDLIDQGSQGPQLRNCQRR